MNIYPNRVSIFKALSVMNSLNRKLSKAEDAGNTYLQKELKEKIDIIAKDFDIRNDDEGISLINFILLVWAPCPLLEDFIYLHYGYKKTGMAFLFLFTFLFMLLYIFTRRKYKFHWIAFQDMILLPLLKLFACSIPVLLVVGLASAVADNPIILLIVGGIALALFVSIFAVKTVVKGTFMITSSAAEIIAEECGASKKTAKNIGMAVGAASVMFAASEVKELVGEAVQDFSPDSDIAANTEDVQGLEQGESSTQEKTWVDGHWRDVGETRDTWVDGHWRNRG